MKITIYTVNDCQFSKQEIDYLTSHQLQFEEKNLELNKEFLTEMLAISDNFAGTPVTKIEKDAKQKDASVQPTVTEPVAEVAPSVAPPLSTTDLSGIPPVPSVVNPV